MLQNDLVVGKILGAHGIMGQIKVEVQSDNPLRFLKGHELFVEKIGKKLKIRSVSEHNGILLLGLEGIDNRTAAEQLGGSLLCADKDSAPKLPEGEYYYFQIEGMRVFDFDTQKSIGTVSEVLANAANDVFVVKREGQHDLLLPALKSVVKRLDIENGLMEVHVPEGLEDL